jgi:hydrogenase maturation protease
MTAPTLIFGWGNPGRGDDALGPLFVERIEAMRDDHPEWGAVDVLTDFQLQVEHALDLAGRQRVLFVDADAANSAEPHAFEVRPLAPSQDQSYTTHAMSPQAIMQVYNLTQDGPLPDCRLLAIQGLSFELGEDLTATAAANLAAALDWTRDWLNGVNER